MKILVLGGGGYLGRVLTQQLHNHGHAITIYDPLFFDFPFAQPAKILKYDVRNYSALESAIKESDAVVNLAAIVGDEACSNLENETRDINLEAAEQVARLCKNYEKWLVFASTCFVYGFNEKEVLTERSRVGSLNKVYPATKIEAEKKIHQIYPAATILRFGTLFGASPRMRYDLVVNIFTAKAKNGEKLMVFGGNQWRPLLHVQDAAASIIHCIHNQLSGILNVHHANYQISTIAEIVSAKTGSEIEIDVSNQDTRSYIVSNKAIRKTGFETQHSILDGVEEMLQLDSWKDYKLPQYSNAKFYAQLRAEGKI